MWRLRLGMLGLLFVGILLVTAAFAPLIAPNDPFEQDIMNSLSPPAWMEDGSWDYPLGTDQVGRCILSRRGSVVEHHGISTFPNHRATARWP